MLNSEAKNFICPFMSKPVNVSGPQRKYDHLTMFEVKCQGDRCMAWVEEDSGGFCNLIFAKR